MVTGHCTSHLGLELGVHISCYFLAVIKCCKSLSSHKTHLGCIKKYPLVELYPISTCLHPHSVLCEEQGCYAGVSQARGTDSGCYPVPSCVCALQHLRGQASGLGSCPGQLRQVIITLFLCWEQVKGLPVCLKERRKPWWGGTVRNYCVYTAVLLRLVPSSFMSMLFCRALIKRGFIFKLQASPTRKNVTAALSSSV